MTNLINTNVQFLDGDSENPLVIKKTQELPPEWLDGLKQSRNESTSRPMGDWHRAASIPTIVHERWLKEGFDCTQEPIAKTLAKLRAESLDYFITTDRRL